MRKPMKEPQTHTKKPGTPSGRRRMWTALSRRRRMWTALSRLLLALLMAMTAPSAWLLQGCTPEPPTMATDAALMPPDASGLRPADSYDEIYQCVLDGLEDSFIRTGLASAASAEAMAAYDAAIAAGESPDQLDSYDPATREELRASLAQGDGIYAINPKVATVEEGVPSSISPTARSDDGLLYVVSFGALRVYSLAGGDSEEVANLPIVGFEGGDGEVRSVSLTGTTLAVQFQVQPRAGNRTDPDYLLAAYGGAQTTVLFFDVSNPADPSYLKTLGISGECVATEVRDGRLYLVVSRMTTPASLANGWDLEGREGDTEAELSAIKGSLDLRQNDPVSFMPAFSDDGNLKALAPEQVYLPTDSDFSSSTIFACFDIASQRCSSVFAVYNPRSAGQADVVWGKNDLYLLWRSARFDEQASRQVFSTAVARVALDGAASSGIAEWTTLADTNLYPAFLEERDGLLVGAAEEVGPDYQRDWSIIALDRQLEAAGRLEFVDGSAGARLGSFAMLGDRAFVAVAGVEEGLIAVDIGEAGKPRLLGSYALDGWPQKLAEIDSGVLDASGADGAHGLLVGYGSEASRELLTMAGVDATLTPPARDQTAILRTLVLNASGSPVMGDPQLIPALSQTGEWRPAWGYDLHVFSELGLVGVPLFNISQKDPDIMLRTRYVLYSIEANGLEPEAIVPEAIVDLTTGQSLSVEALGALGGLAADDGFSTTVPLYDEDSIYLLCAPSSSDSLLPTQMIILDRSTLQVIKTIVS
jgi:hypothetical protein